MQPGAADLELRLHPGQPNQPRRGVIPTAQPLLALAHLPHKQHPRIEQLYPAGRGVTQAASRAINFRMMGNIVL